LAILFIRFISGALRKWEINFYKQNNTSVKIDHDNCDLLNPYVCVHKIKTHGDFPRIKVEKLDEGLVVLPEAF